MKEVEVGQIEHYFGHIGVAAIKIKKGSLKVNDTVRIKGHTTDFTQQIDSMQIEHESVQEAKKGADIGIKVKEKVRVGDVVFKVVE